MKRDYDIATQIHIDLDEIKNDIGVLPYNFNDEKNGDFDLVMTRLIKEAFFKIRRLYN